MGQRQLADWRFYFQRIAVRGPWASLMLGLPLGLLLAFFTTGAIVEAFDSWRRALFYCGSAWGYLSPLCFL